MSLKFELSPEEADLVENSSWLLAKFDIIQKIYGLFGRLSETYHQQLSTYRQPLPGEVSSISPKIYKGEQYRRLPYVMIDFPRYFKQSDALAIRSLFWWGHHFSIHLILGGKYKELHAQQILDQIVNGVFDQWYFSITDNPWEHHFEEDNYQPIVAGANWDPTSATGNYLKLGRLLPINEWQQAEKFFISSFQQLSAI